MRTALSAAFLVSVFVVSPPPAMASALRDYDTACKLEISTQIPAALAAHEIRFKKQRGAGKFKRLEYSLSYAGERSDVVCVVSRDGVKDVRFEQEFKAKIAAAQ
jgi:hypothetical protein